MKIYESKKTKIKRNTVKSENDKISSINVYSPFDPFGSYTGVCKDKNEVPTQDADDL